MFGQKKLCGRAQSMLRRAVGAVAAVAMLSAAGNALAVTNPPAVTKANNQFFDWQVNITPSYVPSPFLINSSANATNAFLEQLPSGSIRAVKMYEPINKTTANLIFNNSDYHVSYVFGDFESGSQTTINNQLKTLRGQIQYVNGQNGTKTYSYNAFLGNFAYSRAGNDGYQPSGVNLPNNGDFSSAKLNMAMPELYAGSGAYRNPAAGNSSAPNIRSALFNFPVLRLTAAKVNSQSGEAVVPYVARFNNWGNLALDSDRNGSNGYKFCPGVAIPARFGLPAVSAADTKNQMLSRRDFATQVLHYRLRGADSLLAFQPGVEDYNNEQKRTDIVTGWTESHVNAIFQKSDRKLLIGQETGGSKDLNDDMIVDNKTVSAEKSGAIYSGIYSLSLGKLDVLMSNMDDDDHTLTLPTKIGGYSLSKKSFDLDGGQHLLVEYKLINSGPGKTWSVALQQDKLFQGLSNDRNECGIPEPTTASLAGLIGLMGLTRRRSRKTAKPQKSGPIGLIAGNLPSDCFVR